MLLCVCVCVVCGWLWVCVRGEWCVCVWCVCVCVRAVCVCGVCVYNATECHFTRLNMFIIITACYQSNVYEPLALWSVFVLLQPS